MIWPDKYWANWKRYLEKAEFSQPNDWMYMNIGWVRSHVNAPNPKRRARRFGGGLILIVILVEFAVWKVILYGPW